MRSAKQHEKEGCCGKREREGEQRGQETQIDMKPADLMKSAKKFITTLGRVGRLDGAVRDLPGPAKQALLLAVARACAREQGRAMAPERRQPQRSPRRSGLPSAGLRP